MKTLIRNAEIHNEGRHMRGSVLIDGELIAGVYAESDALPEADRVLEADGMMLLPGVIDDQVHFREPGLTHKADIASESAAAVAGGVTSFMDMPNTVPQTTTLELLEQKYERAAQTSVANYSFYIGATNDNFDQVRRADFAKVCGIKVFMGSSTGNMLVDNETSLSRIFAEAPAIVATHCEDEATIRANIERYRGIYGGNPPFAVHSLIRSAEACYRSTARAVELAHRYGTRLHVLHLSSAAEMRLFDAGPIEGKRVTAEVCVHHLWFTDADYERFGSRIKWNPSVKAEADSSELRRALSDGRLDVVATDHAPHTPAEKDRPYFDAPSGGPMVQHSLPAMLDMAAQGLWSYEAVVDKMCHAPARLFGIRGRGFVRQGFKADLVLVARRPWTVTRDNILYKCGWSPLEGTELKHKVIHTFVNGHHACIDGKVDTTVRGQRLTFER